MDNGEAIQSEDKTKQQIIQIVDMLKWRVDLRGDMGDTTNEQPVNKDLLYMENEEVLYSSGEG